MLMNDRSSLITAKQEAEYLDALERHMARGEALEFMEQTGARLIRSGKFNAVLGQLAEFKAMADGLERAQRYKVLHETAVQRGLFRLLSTMELRRNYGLPATSSGSTVFEVAKDINVFRRASVPPTNILPVSVPVQPSSRMTPVTAKPEVVRWEIIPTMTTHEMGYDANNRHVKGAIRPAHAMAGFGATG